LVKIGYPTASLEFNSWIPAKNWTDPTSLTSPEGAAEGREPLSLKPAFLTVPFASVFCISVIVKFEAGKIILVKTERSEKKI